MLLCCVLCVGLSEARVVKGGRLGRFWCGKRTTPQLIPQLGRAAARGRTRPHRPDFSPGSVAVSLEGRARSTRVLARVARVGGARPRRDELGVRGAAAGMLRGPCAGTEVSDARGRSERMHGRPDQALRTLRARAPARTRRHASAVGDAHGAPSVPLTAAPVHPHPHRHPRPSFTLTSTSASPSLSSSQAHRACASTALTQRAA